MLGVDPGTLRRWADAGKVEVFQTPGRHRRFLRTSIEAMLPRPRTIRRRSLSGIGEPPDRIAAEFRRRVRADLADAQQDWHGRLDEESLRWFRERGMRMSALLLGYLDARGGQAASLAHAASLGREYGVEAARLGLSLGEATQAFLFFRARFMAEIAAVARRRGLPPAEASLLFDQADRALDRVIVSLTAGHQAR
jgi:hypothetical protein